MRLTTYLIAIACVIGGGVAMGDDHYGRQVRFSGIHPIPKSEGGGMCYIEGPHVHIYAANDLEYRTEGPDHVFVGDPAAYHYDGKTYAYNGPHPMVVTDEDGEPHTEYCYIQGPHFHPFAPEDGPDFKLVGNAYFYVGTPPQAFVDARPKYVGINAVYKPIVYTRPVVDVQAPDGWIGARADWEAPGVAVVAPAVDVEAPAVEVAAPAVEVATPGVAVVAPGAVVVGPHAHAVVGVGVGVIVPPPPVISVGIGVGVGIGGGVVVHGDHGRHRGWHK